MMVGATGGGAGPRSGDAFVPGGTPDAGTGPGQMPDGMAIGPGSDASVGPDPDSSVGPGHDSGGMGSPDSGMRPPRLAAAVIINEFPLAMQASITAFVSEPIDIGDTPGCGVVAADPNAEQSPILGFDMGTVTVSGLRSSDITLTPTADATGNVTYGSNGGVPGDLFASGSTITVSATGGDIARFDLSVPAPNDIQIRSPVGVGVEVDTSRDFTIQWGPGQGEALVVSIVPITPVFEPAAGNWVICNVDDSTGSVSIAAADLQRVVQNQPPDAFGAVSALVAITRSRIVTTSMGVDEAIVSTVTSTGVAVRLTR